MANLGVPVVIANTGTPVAIANIEESLWASGEGMRFKPVPLVGFLGDSLSQFGVNTSATSLQWTNSSYIPWLKRLLRGRMQTSIALDFGVASMKTDHFLNVQVPAAIAAGVDIAFVQIGTNDVQSFTLAQSIANVSAGVAALNAAGIAVVLVSVAPQSGWSAAGRQQAAAYNRFLQSLSLDRARNVRFVDINPVYVDYATGNALSGYQFSDNVHDSPVGGYAKAQRILAATDDLFPKHAELLPISGTADFDATLAPNGNLLTNGIFAGTGGQKATAPAGITGDVATNWGLLFNNSSGTTTITAAGSKGTDATNTTIPTQVITIGGTGDGQYVRLRAQSTPGTSGITIPGGIVAGDRLVFSADIKWTGLIGVIGVVLRLECAGGTAMNVQDGANYKPNSASVSLPVPADFAGGLYQTDPLVLPTGFTSLNAAIEIVPLSGAALAGAVSISRAAVRKI